MLYHIYPFPSVWINKSTEMATLSVIKCKCKFSSLDRVLMEKLYKPNMPKTNQVFFLFVVFGALTIILFYCCFLALFGKLHITTYFVSTWGGRPEKRFSQERHTARGHEGGRRGGRTERGDLLGRKGKSSRWRKKKTEVGKNNGRGTKEETREDAVLCN